jgi:hypothetical protein
MRRKSARNVLFLPSRSSIPKRTRYRSKVKEGGKGRLYALWIEEWGLEVRLRPMVDGQWVLSKNCVYLFNLKRVVKVKLCTVLIKFCIINVC